jgi:hypothetical protein
MISSLAATGVGCASSSDGSDDTTAGSDLTGATGTCRVLHEDPELVVLQTPDHHNMYVPKQLHVTAVRVTPSAPNSSASEWASSRFAASHIDYVVNAVARQESLARLNQLIGPNTPKAPIALDATSGAVDSVIRPASTTFAANSDGSLTATLVDAPAAGPNTPLMTSSLNRGLVTGVRTNANVTCGGSSFPIAVAAVPNGVAFDVTQAQVMNPGADLTALDAFMTTAAAIRNNTFSAQITQVNNPDLAAKMTAFATVVDQEITPVAQQYGVTMTRDDLKTHLTNAWNAYKDLAGDVLTITNNSRKDVTLAQARNADGSYSFTSDTNQISQQLLPSANTIRSTVDQVMAEQGDAWTLKDLR